MRKWRMWIVKLAEAILKTTKLEAEGRVTLDTSSYRMPAERRDERHRIQANAQWWYLDDERDVGHVGSCEWCCDVLAVAKDQVIDRDTLARGLETLWRRRGCLLSAEQRAAVGALPWELSANEASLLSNAKSVVAA